MRKVTFIGAGCNDSNWVTAILNALDSPSRRTLPAGATWPFVSLSVDRRSVEFRMVHIKKMVTPSDAKISLSKLGYIYFKSQDHENDFGFMTLRVNALVKLLREHDYLLDESFERNMFIAKTSLYLSNFIGLVILVTIIVATILRPNG